MNTKLYSQIYVAFAREGARAYFRPKLKDIFQFPSPKRITDPDAIRELNLHRRTYRYIGAVVEMVVGSATFFFVISLSLLLNHVMESVVSRLPTPEKWEGLINFLTGGPAFIAFLLFAFFVLRLVRDILNDMVHDEI